MIKAGATIDGVRIPSTAKLRAFQLTARAGSFKRAAQLLFVTPGAVGTRVRALERDLGVQLFRRGTRQLTLTEAGLVYSAEIEGILRKFDSATRELILRFRPSCVVAHALGAAWRPARP